MLIPNPDRFAAARLLLPAPHELLFRPTPNTANGGCSALVFLPSGPVPPSGYPVALYYHGGGFCQGGADEGVYRQPQQAQQLLAAGIAIASLEYRLIPHVVMSEMCEDIYAGWEWVTSGTMERSMVSAGYVEKGAFDVAKIGAWGHSAGGQAVCWLGSSVSPPMRGVLNFFGITSMATFPSEDVPESVHVLRAKLLQLPCSSSTRDRHDPAFASDNDPDEKLRYDFIMELFRSGSIGKICESRIPEDDPISLVSPSKTCPFYTIHGVEDPVVPLEQGVVFHDKLLAEGVESTLVKVSGAGHGWAVKKGAEGVEGERWDIDERGLDWLIEKILA